MYTRKGDKGETSLHGSRRLAKDSPRVEAYGSIDELNSTLGIAGSMSTTSTIKAALEEIQGLLFRAGADSATEHGDAARVRRISSSDTLRIEEMTDELLTQLPPLKNFILPGGSPLGAHLQLCRAVCRRAERRMLTASRAEKMNPELLPFLNRLSSYLFNLSRWANLKARQTEKVWKADLTTRG
ncbi:MAG TPA: cob(I)yrinic acid a,c-diamide adenosyltransferase [Nitrososphaerales archaeon]|nr:cob(I)yrinic acid a,c-diamide adenosyltransferase [Nitrososphaerales archaeon]